MTRLFFVMLTGILAVSAFVTSVQATPFALSERSDAEIVEHCTSLIDRLEHVPADEKTSAIYLEVGELLRIGKDPSSVNNRLMYVLDPDDEDLLTRTEEFYSLMTVKNVEAFVVKNGGKVIRIPDKDARTVDEESGSNRAAVVIGFPPVEQGDILGWTVTLEGDVMFSEFNRFLAREAWVAHSRFVMKIAEGLSYTARIHNLPASRSNVDARKNDKGQATLIDVHAYDLPRHRESSYSPNPLLVEPYVEAALSAIYWEVARAWFRLDNWNAIALNMDSALEDLLKPDGRIKDKVKELCKGIEGDYERADAMFRFVRDEIADIGSYERRGGDTPAKKILESGIGTPMDKTILLVSMMRQAGLEARIGYLRDRSLGDFDRDAAGMWQVTHTAVLVQDPGSLEISWWVPGDSGAAPQTLPPNLRGAEVVVFREDLEDVAERKWRNAWAKNTYDIGGTYRAFRSSVAKSNWHQFTRTTGNPMEVLATRTETRRLGLESGAEQVTLETTGLDSWARRLRGSTDATEVGEDYAAYRGMPGELSGAVDYTVSDDEQDHRLQWSAEPRIPERMGDTWILPPDLVFGESLLSFWEGADRGPFYMSFASVRESTIEVKLPAGMSASGFQPELEMENTMFVYSSNIVQVEDTLRIHRKVEFKPGLIRQHAISMLDGDIQKILRFDTQSIVVKPVAAGR